MKQRVHYFDVAKGILILLLVMSHFSIALNKVGIYSNNPFFSPWYYPQQLYIVFFMQCFFIVSGFFSILDEDVCTFVKKLVKQLLIPWIFFEIVRVLFFALIGRFEDVFPANEYSTLWFLNALFFAKFICWCIYRVKKSLLVLLIITILFLFVGILLNQFFSYIRNIFYFKNGLIASFFVALGFVLKKHENVYEMVLRYSGYIYIIILLGRFLHFYDLPVQDVDIKVELSSIPLFLLVSLSGSFGFLFLCRNISSNILFEFLGRNTLVIYGLHMLPYCVIIVIMSKFVGYSTQIRALIFTMSVFVLELLAMYMIIKLLNIKFIRTLIGRF